MIAETSDLSAVNYLPIPGVGLGSKTEVATDSDYFRFALNDRHWAVRSSFGSVDTDQVIVGIAQAQLLPHREEIVMRQIDLKRALLVAAIVACGVCGSVGWSKNDGLLLSVDSAQARVGRPLTPVSVAGVARRTTRRAVVGGAVVGGAVVARPRCGYYPYGPCY